jgi:hypothetical protein
MNSARLIAAILALALATGCQKSEPTLRSDTSTDTMIETEPTVPDCTAVTEWTLSAESTTSETGSVDVRVSLASAGTISTCAGPPCLVVTIYGDGTAESVTHESSSIATFTYVNDAMGAGDSVQLLLRWRVLCVAEEGEEERVVTANVNVCADSSANLSVSHEACP